MRSKSSGLQKILPWAGILLPLLLCPIILLPRLLSPQFGGEDDGTGIGTLAFFNMGNWTRVFNYCDCTPANPPAGKWSTGK